MDSTEFDVLLMARLNEMLSSLKGSPVSLIDMSAIYIVSIIMLKNGFDITEEQLAHLLKYVTAIDFPMTMIPAGFEVPGKVTVH